MTTAQTPDYVRPELKAALPTLNLMRDLIGGPRVMWEKAPAYLRKWKDEDPAVYDIRCKAEPIFGGLKRTLDAATGLLFAKNPVMHWGASEARLLPWWDNVDGMGTKGTVFAKRFADAALRDGLALLLVDYPTAPDGVTVTAANERSLGLQPVLAMYQRRDALSWRTRTVGGRTELAQLVLAEAAEVETGGYGIDAAMRYRVLRLLPDANGVAVATWTLLQAEQERDGSTEYVEVGAGVFRNRTGELATSLPIAIAYTGVTHKIMTAEIPLDGVAYQNLQHWKYRTNLTFNREIAGFEQLVVSGQLLGGTAQHPATLKVGPLVAIQVEAGGSVQWVGPSGTGLDQLRQGADECMAQMDQLGLGFLVSGKSVTKTATEAYLDSAAQHATLATAAVGIQDAINAALEMVAWYEGIDRADAPTMNIATDFSGMRMEASVMQAYKLLVDVGFPKRAVLIALQEGGRIPADADLEELEALWETGAIDVTASDADTGAAGTTTAESPAPADDVAEALDVAA